LGRRIGRSGASADPDAGGVGIVMGTAVLGGVGSGSVQAANSKKMVANFITLNKFPKSPAS
jgi:hypothetical protein